MNFELPTTEELDAAGKYLNEDATSAYAVLLLETLLKEECGSWKSMTPFAVAFGMITGMQIMHDRAKRMT
jgi:hypothetical protein